MPRILCLFIAMACASSFGQAVFPSGQPVWGDSVYFGVTSPSTTLRVLGNVVRRDSAAGTLAITTDSCSQAVTVLNAGYYPIWLRGLISYDVRTSGQTDSTQVRFYIDTRKCDNVYNSTGCNSWVPHGRFIGDAMNVVTDSLYSVATAAGTVWQPTSQIFNVPRGNQLRVCVDSYLAGALAGDTVSFRHFRVSFQ